MQNSGAFQLRDLLFKVLSTGNRASEQGLWIEMLQIFSLKCVSYSVAQASVHVEQMSSLIQSPQPEMQTHSLLGSISL